MHEIGHLQVVNENLVNNDRRKFADEGKAQEFANHWRKKLYARHFEHPDLVHNPPSKEELENIEKYWAKSNAEYKKGLLLTGRNQQKEAVFHFDQAIRIWANHAYALEALGAYTYSEFGDSVRAMGLLQRAVALDPNLERANFFLALAYAAEDQETKSTVSF